MSEQPDPRDLLEMAEQAAIKGDFSSADQLLRSAARIQEATLGPLHPDLANTLNNLAIVAEKTSRLGDAETFYRRAATIAAASLPPDDPMVAESRRNLEDFCRERDLPIVAAAPVKPSLQASVSALDAFASEVVTRKAEPPPVEKPAGAGISAQVRRPPPRTPARSSRRLVWVAIGAVLLMTIVLVIARRPSSSPETPPPSPAAPAASPAAPPAAAPSVTPAPIEPAPRPKAVPQGGISLITVQLCQTFSTSGNTWRCDPIGDSAPLAPLVLYTRVRSSRNATVVHRWYREDTLQQSVKLSILANASEGYRTYSRQTVSAGNWRIEVLNAEGDVLHEQRFTVR